MVDIKVLLFSGGMDSFSILHTHPPDKILFFELGTKDNKKEKENLERMINEGLIKRDKVIYFPLDLSKIELDNKIVPHRNSIMALIASNYGNKLYFGTTKGDSTKDKDNVWSASVDVIMNYFALDSHKVAHKEYPYSIEMPFKHMTKTEIVKYYIDNGGSIENLLKYSRSCYAGEDKECGMCRSCLRKIIALENNGIEWVPVFMINPFEFDLPEEDLNKMKSRIGEYEEYIKAKSSYESRSKRVK